MSAHNICFCGEIRKYFFLYISLFRSYVTSWCQENVTGCNIIAPDKKGFPHFFYHFSTKTLLLLIGSALERYF